MERKVESVEGAVEVIDEKRIARAADPVWRAYRGVPPPGPPGVIPAVVKLLQKARGALGSFVPNMTKAERERLAATAINRNRRARPSWLPARDDDDAARSPGPPEPGDPGDAPVTTGLPHHRAIVALDIERSTARTNLVKAEFRRTIYEMFDAALRSAGIQPRHRDRFIDRGDGILALIHPVNQAPKAILLNRAIPVLNRLLTDRNASLAPASRPQRLLRVRVVVHAGEIHYDANGCFGEALDVAFRLLDDSPVKKALEMAADPLIVVISGDIYRSVVWHGCDGIDQSAYQPLVRVQVAGNSYPGWIRIPGKTMAQIANLRPSVSRHHREAGPGVQGHARTEGPGRAVSTRSARSAPPAT